MYVWIFSTTYPKYFFHFLEQFRECKIINVLTYYDKVPDIFAP
jgi:hypothetical protein